MCYQEQISVTNFCDVCFEVTIETKSLSWHFVKISYDLRLLLVHFLKIGPCS